MAGRWVTSGWWRSLGPLVAVSFLLLWAPARAEGLASSLAWVTRDAGGTHVVVGSVHGSRRPLVVADGFAEHRRPSWSPDGRYVLYEAGTGDEHCDVCRLRVSSVFVTRSDGSLPPVRIGSGAYAAWSPNGAFIAYDAGKDGGLKIVDVATGVARRIDAAAYHDCVAWSSDSRRIVSIVPRPGQSGPGGFQNQAVRIVDRDGRLIADYPTDIARFCPALSPDGSRVALRTASNDDERLAIASATSSSTPASIDGPQCAQDIDPAWSRDGQLAFARVFTSQGECSQVGGPCSDLDPCRAGIWELDSTEKATLIAAIDGVLSDLAWNDTSSLIAFELPASTCARCDQVSVVHFVTPHGDITKLDDGTAETFQPRFQQSRAPSDVPWFDQRRPSSTQATENTTVESTTSSISVSSDVPAPPPTDALKPVSAPSHRAQDERGARWPAVLAAGLLVAASVAVIARRSANRSAPDSGDRP